MGKCGATFDRSVAPGFAGVPSCSAASICLDIAQSESKLTFFDISSHKSLAVPRPKSCRELLWCWSLDSRMLWLGFDLAEARADWLARTLVKRVAVCCARRTSSRPPPRARHSRTSTIIYISCPAHRCASCSRAVSLFSQTACQWTRVTVQSYPCHQVGSLVMRAIHSMLHSWIHCYLLTTCEYRCALFGLSSAVTGNAHGQTALDRCGRRRATQVCSLRHPSHLCCSK